MLSNMNDYDNGFGPDGWQVNDQNAEQLGYDIQVGAYRARQDAEANAACLVLLTLGLVAILRWQRRHYDDANYYGRRAYHFWAGLSLASLGLFFYWETSGVRGGQLALALASWLVCWVVALVKIR
jgi:hypothetical protein